MANVLTLQYHATLVRKSIKMPYKQLVMARFIVLLSNTMAQ